MQESRKVSAVERILAVIFPGNTILGLCLPLATVFFRGCDGETIKPPETFTGWQLMPHNWLLFSVPLAVAIALACAIFYRRQANVVFAMFWSGVKAFLAVLALWSFGGGMLMGYHGAEARALAGFWFALSGISGIFVLWWFNLLVNVPLFRAFQKESRTIKVRSKLLAYAIVGDWFLGWAAPASVIFMALYLLWNSMNGVLAYVMFAPLIFEGGAFFVIFWALGYGLLWGQAWAAWCQAAAALFFAGLSALMLVFTRMSLPLVDVVFLAAAAWLIYTIVIVIVFRKTFRRASKLLPSATEPCSAAPGGGAK